jgi:hypothetical protein
MAPEKSERALHQPRTDERKGIPKASSSRVLSAVLTRFVGRWIDRYGNLRFLLIGHVMLLNNETTQLLPRRLIGTGM